MGTPGADSDEVGRWFRRKAATHSEAKRPGGVGAKRRWFFPFLRVCPSGQLSLGFSHRFPFQGDAVSVMDQPVADGIGDGGIGDQLVPVVGSELAGDQGGVQPVAVLKDLE